MQNSFRSIGRNIRDSGRFLGAGLYSDFRTQRTWARVIEGYDNVPEVFKNFFDPHRASGQPFPYTVFTPGLETLGYRITAKLVSVFDREIVFLEANGKGLIAQTYPLDGISFVKMSSMLLDSRFELHGLTTLGIQRSSTVRYSTATDYLFTPVLRKIRLQGVPFNGAAGAPGAEAFDTWITSNFKFMNLARRSLLDGDMVLHAILQPEIRASRFRFLGRTYYTTLSPTHASILTNRELILIHEEALNDREDKYGGIWLYLALNKIGSASMSRKTGGLLTLSIQMLSGECFESIFQASREAEIDRLLVKFQGLRSG
jgi:hypothetical protein